MKNEWVKPTLEMLDISLTMAQTTNGPFTDEAYVPGEWSEDPRFTPS
ncbi:paeninodin family lasso peptide [Alkalihalobacillus pseudalcaliphilus]|nr:paeninodin family lasso peptide [Alkalihalobacillus pseudalcaliphilus]